MDTFDKILISYDSGQIPPPFCHRYRLEINRESQKSFSADLNLVYYDREEITEEEIYEEGFSIEDDFKWNGNFPEVWINEIIKKLNSTNWQKKPTRKTSWSIFTIKISHGNTSEILYPAAPRLWENFSQELIQVIFEIAKKEAPLQISFVSKVIKNQAHRVDFVYSFAQRAISIKSGNKNTGSIDWRDGQKLLKYIFGLDYLPENGLERIPESPGNYISPGDGLWYVLETTGERDREASTVNKLVKFILNFVN
ncbi:MAG: hypothetical protein MI975_02735 [Cytophagales bacterium]|nr:hypothetical protein [Cytophagales bacterium]